MVAPGHRGAAVAARGSAAGGLVDWRWSSLPLLIPPFVVALLLAPMLTAELGVIDDHEIPLMVGPDGRLWPWEWPQVAASWAFGDEGRFRPGYYLLRTVEAMLFGEWAPGWYMVRIALVVASMVAIAYLARPLAAVAVAVVALLLVAGPQAETWYRLGPQEAYGVPLFLGGLAFLHAGRPWLAVALLLASGLMKESFAVALPFAVAWMWWDRREVDRPLAVLTVGTLVICGLVGITLLGGDYYESSRTLASMQIVATDMQDAVMPILLVTLAASVFVPRTALLLIPTVAFLLVQVGVYGGVGIQGRYLYPAILVPLLVLAVALQRLPRPLMAVAIVLLAVSMVSPLLSEQRRAEQWAINSRHFQASLRPIEAHPGPLVITPPTDEPYEPPVSVARYLAGPRPAGPCAEVVFTDDGGTGVCPVVFVVRGLSY